MGLFRVGLFGVVLGWWVMEWLGVVMVWFLMGAMNQLLGLMHWQAAKTH